MGKKCFKSIIYPFTRGVGFFFSIQKMNAKNKNIKKERKEKKMNVSFYYHEIIIVIALDGKLQTIKFMAFENETPATKKKEKQRMCETREEKKRIK